MYYKLILITLFSLFVFMACHKNAITGKRSLNLIPESDIMTMSYSEYDKFLSENKPLPDFNQDVVLVRRVGEKIKVAVEKYYSDKGLSSQLSGFKWEFNVVDDQTVNAWCMPGGKVVFYTGILPITQDETGLAVVMGHEVAHAVARHGSQRMSNAMMMQLGGQMLSVALQQKPQLTQAIFQQSFGISSTLGMLKFSRNHETEADKMGVIFMAMAGYNPEKSIDFWGRMAKLSGGQKPPEFLSTHPSDETRINTLKSFMPEAKKYYK